MGREFTFNGTVTVLSNISCTQNVVMRYPSADDCYQTFWKSTHKTFQIIATSLDRIATYVYVLQTTIPEWKITQKTPKKQLQFNILVEETPKNIPNQKNENPNNNQQTLHINLKTEQDDPIEKQGWSVYDLTICTDYQAVCMLIS